MLGGGVVVVQRAHPTALHSLPRGLVCVSDWDCRSVARQAKRTGITNCTFQLQKWLPPGTFEGLRETGFALHVSPQRRPMQLHAKQPPRSSQHQQQKRREENTNRRERNIRERETERESKILRAGLGKMT